ncbi:MAG: PQQ-binding-like beta-propeller repeat protein, partial [Planctomycetota bacterium]|nr:PQQ-binding-like beta-propeller repeat protein [Planctomycetota bacterium]
TLYVGAGSALYAINPLDGSQNWVYPTGGLIRSSPVIDDDGTIYIGTLDNKLYAVNHNGSFKWAFTTGAQIWSSPAIGPDGTIYVGSLDNKLHSLHKNSTLKWQFSTGGGIYSTPVVGSNGVVYVGSFDGSFYAVNSDGSQKWRVATGGQIWSSAALRNNRVVFGSDDGSLYSVNTNNSADKWQYPIGTKIRSSPTIDADGHIYFGADDGKLYCLSETGALLNEDWPSQVSTGTIRSSVALADAITSTLYVGTGDGRVYAVGPAAVDDPAEIFIQKYSNKTRVSIGEVITYKIVISNLGPDPTSGTATSVIDNIPPGFRYVRSSTLLDNVRQIDPSLNIQDVLIFDVGHFAPSVSKTLLYQLVVGSSVTIGRYVNKAYARYYYDKPPLYEETSNLAKTEVFRLPDPLFDSGTVIGKVFFDKNANGSQDDDEQGYGIAEIIMEDGTTVKTDKNGMYHIPDVMPGTHILHLKDIPGEWITTDNPMLIRVTKGLLVKANFGIHPVEIESSSRLYLKGLTIVALGEGQVRRVEKGKDWQSENKLAYYLSGNIKDKFSITSSFDSERTTYNDGRSTLFPYIDHDKYYLEYGDNSQVSYENTNSVGGLYLKIESLPGANLGKSYFLWGSYSSGIDGTELATHQRTLSGAKLDVKDLPLYQSEHLKLTAAGVVFASQDKQIPANEEFRSTGGSIYYLKHREIIIGSELIRVETRDKLTGFVIRRELLVREQDYEIDYSNG